MSDATELKARVLLAEGRVRVQSLSPTRVEVEVKSTDTYLVIRSDALWACPCKAQVSNCSHILAADLVVPAFGEVEGNLTEEDTYDPFDFLDEPD